ncbi:MAG: Na+/H+ antiporter NhaC family protein [Clostridia bacterium]|nr:Na+/H+ antiporter NhaC family protein [Clostridia bacterium]
MNLGILSVLPILLMVILVITTKKVFESLLVSTVFVFILKDGTGFIGGIVDAIYGVFAAETYPWIMLMLTLFGALVQLLLESKGVDGFRKIALRYIKSEKSSLIFTWILGVVLCIDDYINDLAIGPSVRTITDKHKVPREAIGFIILAMGIPVCALLPVSAMAVFVFGVMQDAGISSPDANMLTEYLKVMQFLVYPVLIIVMALLVAIGIVPKIGPLKKLYKNRETIVTEKAEEEEESNGNLIDFIVPVLVVVGVMLVTNDLVTAVICALAACFVLYVPRKKMSFEDYFKNFFEGIHSMIDILVILLLVFAFVSGLQDIGFSDYVISTCTPILVGGVIPMLSFIIVSLLVFGGVDYWAVILLMAPITVPLAANFDVNQYLTMAAVVSGAICGGTSCFFSEQMLMCGQAVEKDSVDLAVVTFPYALICFVLTAIVYGVLGFVI